MANIAKIMELYTAYFNRAADKNGVDYWAKEMDTKGWTLDDVAKTFAQQPEYNALYDGKTNAQIVALVYTNVLGRTATAEDATYWETQLTNGAFTVSQLIQAVVNAATEMVDGAYVHPTDAAIVNNKTAVSQHAYDSNVNATDISLATVTATDNSAAISAVDAMIPPVQGQVITLTNGIDYKDGTAGDDIFDGLQNAQGTATLNSSDRLDGKAGNDKLVAELSGGTIATTTVSIETAEVITTAASTLDTINMSGLNNITIKNGSAALTVNNIASTSVAITQLDQAADYNLNYTNAALSGANNVALKLNGAQSDANGGAAVAISQQAGTNTSGAETVTVDSIGSNSNFLASLASTNAAGTSTITALTATGTQSLTIATALNASVATVDASALTAGLSASFANTASNMSVKGGTGNDTITLTANTGNVTATMGTGDDTLSIAGFTTADVLDGGEGTDTLSITAANSEAILAALTNTKNFEALTLNTITTGGATTNATYFGDIATVNLTGAAASTLVMGAGAKTVNVGSAGTANNVLTGTLTITDTGTASTDVLTINNIDLNALDGNTFNGQGLTINGYETVNINTGTVVTAAQTLGAVAITGDSSTADQAIKFTGINGITLGAPASSNSSGKFTIDASGLTGAATFSNAAQAPVFTAGAQGTVTIIGSNNASNAAGLGDTLVGHATLANTINAGAGNDTVTGGAVADTIDLGDGNDTLNASTGNDTVIGGLGNDTMTAGVGEQTLNGGAGNDRINMGATLSASDVISGGEGTDTLSITTAATAALAAGVTGFETLSLAATVTQDMIQFTNNTDFVAGSLLAAANTYSFNNASASFATVSVEDTNAGAGDQVAITSVTVARLVDTATNALTINAATVDVNTDAGSSTITTFTANNEETITINGGEVATEDMTITTLNASDLKTLTLVGGGDVIITNAITGATDLATVTATSVTGAVTVNASQSTANMTMNGSLSGINALTGGTGADTITGGSAADTINGGNGNDTINGGAGNDGNVIIVAGTVTASGLIGGAGNDTIDGGIGDDAILGGADNDTLTGGLGNDVFTFSAMTYVNAGAGAAAGDLIINGNGIDTITDFKTTVDKLDLTQDAAVNTTAAGGANSVTFVNDNAYIITTNGAAANLTTLGSATLTTSDLTATTLTNVAAYLDELFVMGAEGTKSDLVLNWTAGGSTKSYVYHIADLDGVATIGANEIALIGIVERGSLSTDVLVAADIA